MDAAAISARITMPAPPPAGVSSTERCLSVAKSRMSMAASAHLPSAKALPARLKPNGSFDTVRFHLKHIYQKLHVRSRSEALIKYLQ